MVIVKVEYARDIGEMGIRIYTDYHGSKAIVKKKDVSRRAAGNEEEGRIKNGL